MTPELEAKAREWISAHGVSTNQTFGYFDLAEFALARVEKALEIERAWWIERIEQERDKWNSAVMQHKETAYCGGYSALDDLLTSVRERGGK